MVTYAHCRKEELFQFVRDRGARVQPTGKRAGQILKQDLVRALRDADANRTFRFLGLPAELRNLVYRELLVIKGSPTARCSPKCRPHILRANKEINQEASSILYGDNLIEVKVYAAGVYAHGIRCGPYQPESQWAPQSKNIIWPDFLRRAHFVRMTIFDTQSHPQNQQEPPKLGTIHKVLFSLCVFLQESSILSSLTLDLTWPTARYITLGRPDTLATSLQTAVYPLRILRKRVDARLVGIEPVPLQQPISSNQGAADVAKQIVSGSRKALIRQVQATLGLTFLLATGESCSATVFEALTLIANGSSAGFAAFGFVLMMGHAGELREFLRDCLGDVRSGWDGVYASLIPAMLKKQMDGLTMLAVEIERAMVEEQAG